MAALYMTSVTISAPGAQLKKLHDELKAALALTIYEPNWLGNLWVHLGKDAEDARSGKLGRCAGEVDAVVLKDGELVVVTCTKCEPMLAAVKDFVAEYAPDAKLHCVGQPLEP